MDCSYRMGTRVEPLFVTAEDRGRIVMTMSGGGFHAALLVADVTRRPTGSSIALVSQPQWRRYLPPAAAWGAGTEAACPD